MKILDETKKYDIIYADPPWNYSNKGLNGSAEKHYKTMNLEEICKLPIKDISSDNCALFLWTTYPMIFDSIKVIESWGFKYKTLAFQWVKLNKKNQKPFFGLGQWTRSNSEPCLLAVKGKPKRISCSVSQLILSNIEKHSKKPDIVRNKIIELMGDLPRIELFARQKAEGWDNWGDEI